MKRKVWLTLTLLLITPWVAAIGFHAYRAELPSMVTSILGLLATLLIFGALRSRSRKSMYPRTLSLSVAY